MLKPKEIKKGLSKKGWKEVEKTNHTFYYFQIDGKVTYIYTFLSRGTKEYNDFLINKMKNQIHLNTNQQVVEYVKCKLTNREYLKILEEKGRL